MTSRRPDDLRSAARPQRSDDPRVAEVTQRRGPRRKTCGVSNSVPQVSECALRVDRRSSRIGEDQAAWSWASRGHEMPLQADDQRRRQWHVTTRSSRQPQRAGLCAEPPGRSPSSGPPPTSSASPLLALPASVYGGLRLGTTRAFGRHSSLGLGGLDTRLGHLGLGPQPGEHGGRRRAPQPRVPQQSPLTWVPSEISGPNRLTRLLYPSILQ
jgi:hypothetical protein